MPARSAIPVNIVFGLIALPPRGSSTRVNVSHAFAAASGRTKVGRRLRFRLGKLPDVPRLAVRGHLLSSAAAEAIAFGDVTSCNGAASPLSDCFRRAEHRTARGRMPTARCNESWVRLDVCRLDTLRPRPSERQWFRAACQCGRSLSETRSYRWPTYFASHPE